MKLWRLLIGGFCLLAINWSQQLSAMNVAAAPGNYRQLIADSDLVKSLRGNLNLASPSVVSELRPSVLTQAGDWTACVRVSASGSKASQTPKTPHAAPHQRPRSVPSLRFYAFFFANGAVVDSRPTVIIDRCAGLNYSPLSAARDGKTLEK